MEKREKYKSTKPLLRGEMGQGLDKQAGIQSLSTAGGCHLNITLKEDESVDGLDNPFDLSFFHDSNSNSNKERIEENRCRFYVNEIHKFKSVISLTKFAFFFTFTKVSLEKNFSNIQTKKKLCIQSTLHIICNIKKKKLEKIFTFDFYFRNFV